MAMSKPERQDELFQGAVMSALPHHKYVSDALVTGYIDVAITQHQLAGIAVVDMITADFHPDNVEAQIAKKNEEVTKAGFIPRPVITARTHGEHKETNDPVDAAVLAHVIPALVDNVKYVVDKISNPNDIGTFFFKSDTASDEKTVQFKIYTASQTSDGGVEVVIKFYNARWKVTAASVLMIPVFKSEELTVKMIHFGYCIPKEQIAKFQEKKKDQLDAFDAMFLS